MDRIPQEVFEDRTGIGWMDPDIRYVISLRDMDPGAISDIRVMERSTLGRLLDGVVLERSDRTHPYRECSFNIVQMDPESVVIGQTFVQRAKYQSLLEDFGDMFGNGFCIERAIGQCGPLIVYGADAEGVPCVAFYLPPIVETTNGRRFLIDGVHRNFIMRAVGGTMKTIEVLNVRTPLPCDPVPWKHVGIVTDKPPRRLRFNNLRTRFFRNTKFVGIDG